MYSVYAGLGSPINSDVALRPTDFKNGNAGPILPLTPMGEKGVPDTPLGSGILSQKCTNQREFRDLHRLGKLGRGDGHQSPRKCCEKALEATSPPHKPPVTSPRRLPSTPRAYHPIRRQNVQAAGHNVRVAHHPCGTSSMILFTSLLCF